MDTAHANPELFAALALAQGEIENASKNAANPHFKSKYADLAEVLNTLRPVLSKHGLSLIQSTEFNGSLVSVVTVLGHKAGGYLTATASCVPAKTDAQGVGSATTYLRRYSAAALVGIAQEDDDGQSAAHTGKPAPVTEEWSVKANDFAEAMTNAGTAKALQEIGTQLAASKMPDALKKGLRELYARRVDEMREAA